MYSTPCHLGKALDNIVSMMRMSNASCASGGVPLSDATTARNSWTYGDSLARRKHSQRATSQTWGVSPSRICHMRTEI